MMKLKKNRNEWDTECSITNIPFIESMGEEVHIFMHVHMRGYDRTGEGRVKDAGYYDKYGAPAAQKDSWMDGMVLFYTICSIPSYSITVIYLVSLMIKSMCLF